MQKLLREMVETYGDRIYRLALRYTGNREQAEDIAQETFLRAYKHLDRFDRNRPAGPWLFKIATNLCRSWNRIRRETQVEALEKIQPAVDKSPEDIYLEKESEAELHRVLHGLPLQYREILLLRHVGELAYAEIAETLGLELSVVKNRLYRGRIMLREVLQEERR